MSSLKRGAKPWRLLRSSIPWVRVGRILIPFEKKVVSCVVTVVSANFCNREEELKNALATSRSKVRDLEIRV
jgi:hypothetical protein